MINMSNCNIEFFKFLKKYSTLSNGIIPDEMAIDLCNIISNEKRFARNQALLEAVQVAKDELDKDESWRIPESIGRLMEN